MTNISKKAILAVLILLFIALSSLLIVNISAKAELNEAAISAQLKPIRSSEYGEAGDLYVVDKDVYKNYEYGCVTAKLGADNTIISTRDYGGVNYNNTTGELEFLKDGNDYKLKSMILSRGVEDNLKVTWDKLANKFDSNVSYDVDYALQKIYEKYVKMCESGYNCGIATDILSVWDEAVIKLDFFDGECRYGFDSEYRVHVTTIAYSFLMDEAFAITGDVFNFYKDAKAGSLSEPITDTFDYTEKGVEGTVQAFALGYIFCPSNGADLVVRAGTRWNPETEKFEVLELDYDELTASVMDDEAISNSPYYANKGYRMDDYIDENGNEVEGIKTRFYNKYQKLIKEGFNPGLPDSEGIYYWDTELLKQAYVGSDGTGNAWGRTNMMLILNPEDGKVYVVRDEILNLVDKASHGLGNARSLGYPMGDPQTTEINGLTYTYQNFYRPYYNEVSTIYSIENSKQLTRHVVGTTFEDLMSQNSVVKPNNPMYFYVVEPWIIAIICVIPVVVVCAGVAVFIVLKKKSNKQKPEQSVAAEGADE